MSIEHLSHLELLWVCAERFRREHPIVFRLFGRVLREPLDRLARREP